MSHFQHQVATGERAKMPSTPWWKLGKNITYNLSPAYNTWYIESICLQHLSSLLTSPGDAFQRPGLAICDIAGSPRHWSQEQGLLDSWVLVWIIHIIVFFPSTQGCFSQSHTRYAFKRSHHDSRGVEGSQKPQKDLVLRLKAAVVITPFYKEQYLMSTTPLLPHLTFQQAWEQIFKQSAGEQQEEQDSNLQSAWQNVPVARWAQEKAGPCSCWVGGTGKSMAFLRKRTAGLVGKPRPCSALSFISACRKVLHGLLNHQWVIHASALTPVKSFTHELSTG